MTIEEMQALRNAGYTACEVAMFAGRSLAVVEKRTWTDNRVMTPRFRQVWSWLREQYEPVRPEALAAILGIRRSCAARRLRRMKARGLVASVGRGLWVAMDHEPMTIADQIQRKEETK